MRARKKPVTVEVWRVGGPLDDIPEWVSHNDLTPASLIFEQGGPDEVDHCVIRTLEGSMVGNHGDWIIKGVKGELYPCDPEIFAQTYELLPEPTQDTYDR